MLKLLTSSIIILLALVPSSSAQGKHYGKFGELVVTATGMTSAPVQGEDARYVAVFVRVRYGGTDLACASLSAKLKTTDNSDYADLSRLPSDRRWPDRPRVSRLSHGQESTGAYVFQIRNGADPVALLVTMDSQDTACDSAQTGALDGASPPAALELDVHDLSLPQPDTDSSTGLPFSGHGGYSFPTCVYCPRADDSLEAIKAKVSGTVQLLVTITAEGVVTDVYVRKGLGYGLDEKAVEAVREWRLKPAYAPDGKPAAVRQTIEVTFQLKR